jgi:hypothetical protein
VKNKTCAPTRTISWFKPANTANYLSLLGGTPITQCCVGDIQSRGKKKEKKKMVSIYPPPPLLTPILAMVKVWRFNEV